MSEALTDLERHVSYFDPDRDGSITLAQTFRGLRDVGVVLPVACLLTVIINVFLGYLTHRKPSLSVSVNDIARGKHPYDTGVFDAQGNLNEPAFERLFQASSTNAPLDRLTEREIRAVIIKKGDPTKPFGELGSLLSNWFSGREIQLLLCVSSDCTKLTTSGELLPAISRRSLRRFYTGRLLFLLARRRRIALARERAL
ncbi:MAG TPA: caleosin family protein [Polyangiaceae bacterium]|jgi:hypothetical protein